MESLAVRLRRQYARHYARMNRPQSFGGPSAKQQRALERTYGGLLRRLPPGSRVADVGCGAGHLLSWLSGHAHLEVVGVDQSAEQLAAARAISTAELVCADGKVFLESRPASLAGIFCFDVLEHLTDAELIDWVDGALRALQPGGFLCCRCPNAANILSGYSRYLDLTHIRSFTRTSLLQLLDASGFENCAALPQRGGWWGAEARLAVEWGVHRWLYHLCGRRPEDIVTGNVAVVGYRGDVGRKAADPGRNAAP